MVDYRYGYYQDEHPRSYLVLLSLLLHSSIILFFILIEVKEEIPVSFVNQEEQNPVIEPSSQSALQQAQAALFARSSNFGAPVIFSDDLQLPPTTTPATRDDSDQTNENVEKENKNFQETMNLEQKQESMASSTPIPITAQSKQPKKIIRKQKKIITGSDTQIAGPIKKQLTFADLAAGFLQTIHRDRAEGNAMISRAGDPNLKPNEMDLKYSSYMAKFHWYIENSSRLHPLRPEPPFTNNMVAKILVTIDKEGNVKNVQIVQESGRQDLDNHIEKIIKKAAPFPELPDHFGTNIFTFPLAFNVIVYPGSRDGEYIFASQ